MKLEHRAIIERAQLHGCMPSEIASELLEHDLINMVIDQIPNFGDWSENTQQLTIERVTLGVKDAVNVAIRTIAAKGVITIPLTVQDAKFKPKAITIAASIDVGDPNGVALSRVAGKLCLLALAPNEYGDGIDAIHPDRDQKDLPLHVSDLTGSLFEHQATGPDEPDGESQLGTAEELAQRTGGAGNAGADLEKEFGDFTYDDAKQLIVLKANKKAFKGHWVQSRLAIDSDKTATLLLRLLDDKVLEIETEGESAFDHSFKVIATLEEVV
ncbi:DNA translocase FtsK [Pseudomonas sp. ArH3a]|uniref:DNA translocase FtsK n=1 Tax=Pseudomonas sp. ArH3a TaxID=2862945 RepID=UPI001F5929F6|nr:DNA translocase FtsK [Pseudomonas sp. ArH3a]UNM20878.1 DNA translocase FtsK [Pseudomonas sp. ArH3a]